MTCGQHSKMTGTFQMKPKRQSLIFTCIKVQIQAPHEIYKHTSFTCSEDRGQHWNGLSEGHREALYNFLVLFLSTNTP